jgi:hypothetical protein
VSTNKITTEQKLLLKDGRGVIVQGNHLDPNRVESLCLTDVSAMILRHEALKSKVVVHGMLLSHRILIASHHLEGLGQVVSMSPYAYIIIPHVGATKEMIVHISIKNNSIRISNNNIVN